MRRIIPRRTKVKLEFLRGVTGIDLIIAVIVAAVSVILFASNFANHIWIALVWLIVGVSLFFKFADDERFYVTITHLFRFFVQKKRFSIQEGKKRCLIKFHKLLI